MDYVKLNNGVEMPVLGYGVYQTPPEETERCVREALEAGYRSVDTAQAYYNEEGVGAALSGAGVPREDVFLTTKVWITNAGQSRAAASIDESLRKLRTDYVDLLLVHQPFGDYYGTWRAMEQALADGRARAIGVSNFYPDRLVDLCGNVDVIPAVNQVETHVFQQQRAARAWMDKYGVQIESWGPFAEGRNDMFTDPVLTAIGQAHSKSAAQIALRFLVQSGVVVIPKSTHRERMEQNIDVFDFVLGDDEMGRIQALDRAESLFLSHTDPESVEFLISLGR